jgi:hypothetical protein
MSSSSFLNQMIMLRDRISPLADKFGIPTVRTLIIRTRTSIDTSFLEITPKPVIKEISPEKDETPMRSIQGVSRKFSVKGISRRYTQEQLQYLAVDYLVDGYDGIPCQFVSLVANALTWDLEIEEKITEPQLY